MINLTAETETQMRWCILFELAQEPGITQCAPHMTWEEAAEGAGRCKLAGYRRVRVRALRNGEPVEAN